MRALCDGWIYCKTNVQSKVQTNIPKLLGVKAERQLDEPTTETGPNAYVYSPKQCLSQKTYIEKNGYDKLGKAIAGDIITGPNACVLHNTGGEELRGLY